ncbi:MAG: hypothetical protein LUD15_10785 [Bacteroides sp.]|nr:hypothetical protein [Bacteroides sp.]
MCKLNYCIVLLFCSVQLFAFPENKQMLVEVDRLISSREEFEQQKRDRIHYLKQLLVAEKNLDKEYDLICRIVEEYANFQSDSAFVYIERGKEAALRNKNHSQLLENRFQYTFVCAQSGLMTESLSVLDQLQVYYKDMSREQRAIYYVLYERLYMNLREYAENSHMEAVYAGRERL